MLLLKMEGLHFSHTGGNVSALHQNSIDVTYSTESVEIQQSVGIHKA